MKTFRHFKMAMLTGMTLLLTQQITCAATYEIPSKFSDGRFNTYSYSADQSYRPKLKLWTGDTVENVIIRTNKSFDQLKKLPEKLQYERASKPQYKNQVILCQNKRNCIYSPTKLNFGTQSAFNNGTLFNNKTFNNYLLQMVNKDRKAIGVKPLKYSSALQKGANIRAQELANYGHIEINRKPHVRPNHSRFSTAFTNIPNAAYKVGENTGMNFYRGNPYEIVSEKYMAEKFYKQWKSSPGHYKNMLRPYYKTMAVSVKMSQYNRIEIGRYSYFYGVQAFSK